MIREFASAVLGVWPPGQPEIPACLELLFVCKVELNNRWPTVCAG